MTLDLISSITKTPALVNTFFFLILTSCQLRSFKQKKKKTSCQLRTYLILIRLTILSKFYLIMKLDLISITNSLHKICVLPTEIIHR